MANAGVVGMTEVITPTSQGRKLGGSPAMWSYIWVAVAAFILVFMNMALIGRGR
jgi:hypothetical protein